MDSIHINAAAALIADHFPGMAETKAEGTKMTAYSNIGTHNSERDADAMVWARALGMGDTMFKNVPVGAKFSFQRDSEIYTRTASGYRYNGRTCKTGARTACFIRA